MPDKTLADQALEILKEYDRADSHRKHPRADGEIHMDDAGVKAAMAEREARVRNEIANRGINAENSQQLRLTEIINDFLLHHTDQANVIRLVSDHDIQTALKDVRLQNVTTGADVDANGHVDDSNQLAMNAVLQRCIKSGPSR